VPERQTVTTGRLAVEFAAARRQLAQRQQPGAGMWPSGAGELAGSRTSTTCTVRQPGSSSAAG
jgi:hypothetical protein